MLRDSQPGGSQYILKAYDIHWMHVCIADADFLIYHNLENCVAAEPTCLDGSAVELKALRKFMASVGALDGLREYLASRPPMGVGAEAGGVGLAGSIMATTVDRDD